MAGKPLFISVVIPFRNAAHCLPCCLEGLARQTYPHFECILVDNGSRDGGAEVVRRFAAAHPGLEIKELSEEKPGASAARNRGVAAARGAWIAFTDADCIPAPEWLAELAAAVARAPEMGAFAGCIRPAAPANAVEKILALFTLPAYAGERIHRAFRLTQGGFPTANLALRRELFARVGGFDERIRIYGEDHALCARIYQAGSAIKTLSGAPIVHRHRAHLKGLCRQSYGFGRSHALSLRTLVPGAFVVEAPPLFGLVRIGRGARVWLDLGQADKKMALCLAAAFCWPPLWVLAPIFFCYQCVSIHRRARKKALPVSWRETPLLALLFLLKSAAMSAGRCSGSLRYGVLCL